MPQEIGQIYKTLIPSLSDDASIEQAMQMYHYGTAAYNGNNLQPQSIERHLIDLNDDVSRIDNTIANLANVYIEETSTSARPNVIVSQEPTTVPLTLLGVLGQTAPLQRWQRNTGTVSDVALISGAGSAAFAGYLSVGSTTVSTTVALPIVLGGDHKGITVRGVSGQTQNLQEWQNNSGTILSRVDSTGKVHTPEIVAQDASVSNNTNLNTLTVTGATTAASISATSINLSGTTGLTVQNASSLQGNVTIAGTTTSTKNITADGTITATGTISSNGNISAGGTLSGTSLSLSQNLTTTGNITANGIIRAKSPNQGTTGAIRIIADANGDSYLQFVNAADNAELVNIRATSTLLTISRATTISGNVNVVSPTTFSTVSSGVTASLGTRQVYFSTSDAPASVGANGDIWIRYIA